LQLWNTFNQHERTFKASKQFDGNRLAAKVEPNQIKTLGGDFYKEDALALTVLDSVLSEEFAMAGAAPVPTGKRTRRTAGNNS
jgi:hypothetical protein